MKDIADKQAKQVLDHQDKDDKDAAIKKRLLNLKQKQGLNSILSFFTLKSLKLHCISEF